MDIRTPIGYMFSILGLILVVCGFIQTPEDLKKALDWNINLYWGLVMVAFGVFMLVLACRAKCADSAKCCGKEGCCGSK